MSVIDSQIRDEFKPLIKYDKPKIVASGVHYQRKQDLKRIIEMDEEGDYPTEDVLNAILPPREFIKDKEHLYVEHVLSTPATRTEVCMLYQELDKRLEVQKARESGICPIREKLYSQTFDELIRQVTIKLAHRGLLLVRVRNEFKNHIDCYQKLYESSLAFGMRKALQGQQSKMEKLQKIRALEEACARLEGEVQELDEAIDKKQKESDIKIQKDKEGHEEEVLKTKQSMQWMKDTISKRLQDKENEFAGKNQETEQSKD